MAEKRRTRKKKPQKRTFPRFSLKRRQVDFKPDAQASTWLKTLRMTRQQRLRLTKWSLYALTIILCQVTQDVLMSRIRFLGSTTDLTVCAILLITVLEGTEVGSLFALIASTLYYFSGTAPGAFCIGLITVLGVAAVMFRQLYWHRSKGSIVLCAAIAVFCYELALFVVGLSMELTLPNRVGLFALNGVYSAAAMIPLYPLIHKIGLIGGNTWKE